MFPQHNLGLFDRADLGSRQTPPVRNGSSNPPGGTSGDDDGGDDMMMVIRLVVPVVALALAPVAPVVQKVFC